VIPLLVGLVDIVIMRSFIFFKFLTEQSAAHGIHGTHGNDIVSPILKNLLLLTKYFCPFRAYIAHENHSLPKALPLGYILLSFQPTCHSVIIVIFHYLFAAFLSTAKTFGYFWSQK
jgi:hypothetical protein